MLNKKTISMIKLTPNAYKKQPLIKKNFIHQKEFKLFFIIF
jgi:hypothetical protein